MAERDPIEVLQLEDTLPLLIADTGTSDVLIGATRVQNSVAVQVHDSLVRSHAETEHRIHAPHRTTRRRNADPVDLQVLRRCSTTTTNSERIVGVQNGPSERLVLMEDRKVRFC